MSLVSSSATPIKTAIDDIPGRSCCAAACGEQECLFRRCAGLDRNVAAPLGPQVKGFALFARSGNPNWHLRQCVRGLAMTMLRMSKLMSGESNCRSCSHDVMKAKKPFKSWTPFLLVLSHRGSADAIDLPSRLCDYVNRSGSTHLSAGRCCNQAAGNRSKWISAVEVAW